ncbi:MAG: ATP-binding cassette domain-containing protein [Acidobacteria bacterium]|nr:ATP-binding cassette domain-containing protein [Acidobacteriota bacterium]
MKEVGNECISYTYVLKSREYRPRLRIEAFNPSVVRSSIQLRNSHRITDLNLTVEPGEILMLMGRNGSGKSTILKLIAGLIL